MRKDIKRYWRKWKKTYKPKERECLLTVANFLKDAPRDLLAVEGYAIDNEMDAMNPTKYHWVVKDPQDDSEPYFDVHNETLHGGRCLGFKPEQIYTYDQLEKMIINEQKRRQNGRE